MPPPLRGLTGPVPPMLGAAKGGEKASAGFMVSAKSDYGVVLNEVPMKNILISPLEKVIVS